MRSRLRGSENDSLTMMDAPEIPAVALTPKSKMEANPITGMIYRSTFFIFSLLKQHVYIFELTSLKQQECQI